MSLSQIWSTFKLLNFSKPAGDRPLYRAVRHRKIQTVLEVNIGDARRSYRLVEWLRQQGNDGSLRYAAIDLFEMGEQNQIELKTFHQQLSKRGVKPLPIPGTLVQGLPRAANSLGIVDLAIFDIAVGELQDPAVQATFHRLIGPDTLVMCRSDTGGGLKVTTDLQGAPIARRRAA